MKSISFRRRATDRIMKTLFLLSVFLVILPLFLIFFDLLWKGAKELKWSLLTDLPRPVGEPGGGIAHGATDELGYHAVEDPHYVTDVHATIHHLLGIDARRLEVPGFKRLDVDYGRVIEDILA